MIIPQQQNKINLSKNHLDEKTEKVKLFYESEQISYQMPGRKDTIKIINSSNEKVSVQKKYMLMTVDKAYQIFKEQHPLINIGLSSFYKLKPPHILFISKIPHDFCCCIYCQNFELLFSALKPCLDPEVKSADIIIEKLTCGNNFACFANKCNQCKNLGISTLINTSQKPGKWLKWLKQGNFIQKNVIHYQSISELVSEFSKVLPSYKLHKFLVKTQHISIADLKQSNSNSSAIIWMDFSENFSLTSQNEIQAVYYCRRQVSLFTVMTVIGQNQKQAFCIVSDDLDHSKQQVSIKKQDWQIIFNF